MKTINVTVKQFSEMHDFKSMVEANSVMNVLKAKGLVRVVGKKKPAGGKGKPATIYEIPQTVKLELFKGPEKEFECPRCGEAGTIQSGAGCNVCLVQPEAVEMI
jgi:hypothetical protein